jgi:endonuclease-3
MLTPVQRAKFVGALLAEQYPDIGPFLLVESQFQLLVAVVLSARCTDRQVNRVTPALFARGGTARELADLPLEEVEALIHSVGFFRQKARSLRNLSRRIAEEFDGNVPMDFATLESLPGVGHKTAAVVIGSCTDTPTFPVDTHVARLSRRWDLTGETRIDRIEERLKQLFPSDQWQRTHRRMIAYGREICTARGCNGWHCSICRQLREVDHR